MRGDLLPRRHVPAELGPIPAGAGRPRSLRAKVRTKEAYPRGCGATSLQSCWRETAWGLSPRVRGDPAAARSFALERGPIPAGAGRPRLISTRSFSGWAYPRGCGATDFILTGGLNLKGLSPRVRGDPMQCGPLAGCVGPIPAGAGRPRRRASPLRQPPAYPRGCGATPLPSSRRFRRAGLSPRVRGDPALERYNAAGGGPIPAGAGRPWGRSAR